MVRGLAISESRVAYAGIMNYPQELRRMRQNAGFTQTELAEKLGVSDHWVSKRETSTTRIKIEDLEEWCEACGYVCTVRIQAGIKPADPEAMATSDRILEAWDNLDSSARRMLRAVIEAAAERP